MERLPVKAFEHLRDNPEEMKKLVIRMNDRIPADMRAREAIKLRHAYIDNDLLDEYLSKLLVEIPTERNARTEFYYLQKYFLNFFINKLGARDPLKWKQNETKWAQALLNNFQDPEDRQKLALLVEGRRLSSKVLRTTVYQANRFMAFVHDRRPDVCPPIEFTPLSRAVYRKLDATRKLDKSTKDRKPVTDADWKIIVENLPDDIKSPIMICYHFGVRRAEALGLQPSDVLRGALHVARQLVRVPDKKRLYGPLKGRELRDVPYWFCGPGDAYEWISSLPTIHPDTFTDRWNILMDKLGLDYDIHDLRHTWCTKAGRIIKLPRELQLAAGHKDLRTTMKYMKDDSSVDRTVWVPDA